MRFLCRPWLIMSLSCLSLARGFAEDSQPANPVEIASTEIRVIVEQYQAVLAGHADIICEYNFACGPSSTYDDAIARRLAPGASEYPSAGIYKSKGGKVLASEYSLETPTDLGNNTQRGGTTSFLTNAEWRTLFTPDFHIITIGHRGSFKNDRWGPTFAPWSLGVQGNTMHLPGSENLSVYNHITENLDSTAVSAKATTIQIPGRHAEESAICVSVTSGKGMGTRNYYFTTPQQYAVPLLSKFEMYVKESKALHTIAYVIDYGPSPSGLPFPMNCIRVTYPLTADGPFNSVWTKVTKLEKSDQLQDSDFFLNVRNGQRVVLEDSGIGVRIEQDSKLDFAGMELLEKKILEKIENQEKTQEIAATQISSHRTRYSLLLWANIIGLALLFGIALRKRSNQTRDSTE